MKVLLVAEEPLLRTELLNVLLWQKGFATAAVAHAEEALLIVDSGSDMIVSDISGKKLSECLREIDALSERFPGCRFVLLDSRTRVFTRSFQKALRRRHVMAYTYRRDICGIADLLDSVAEHYTSFPQAFPEPSHKEGGKT